MADETTSDFSSSSSSSSYSKDEQSIINETLRFVAERSARVTGSGFFYDLVTFLGETLDVAYALCDKVVANDNSKVETLALFADGEIVESVVYNLKDTPCENVLGRTTCCYIDNIQKRFPKDQLLVDMNAESYAGVPLWSANGSPLGLIAVVDDKPITNVNIITTVLQIVAVRAGAELERLQDMEALKLSKQRFTDFAKSSSDWFWEMDAELRFTYFSEQFEAISGYQAKSILGKTYKQSVINNVGSRRRLKHQEDLDNRRPFHDYIYTRLLDGGRQIWLSISGMPVFNDKDIFIGYRGTGKDITERVNMEENLRMSQKMDALGHLTAGIAHDYNNTLGVILGYTTLLKKQLVGHIKLLGYVDHIHGAGERGAKLTKRLLAFSQKQSYEESKLDISNVLLKQQDMLQKTMTVRIKLLMELTDNLWPVRLDRNELEDLILNICINALHAMDDPDKPAELTIRTTNLNLNTLDAMIIDVSPGDYVQLSFTDTGCGMSQMTRDKIFEPFFSTKGAKGTGLGLSQAFGFVKRSGGVITVSSELGLGTQFNLYFPRFFDKDRQSAIANDNSNQNAIGTENILIVDDEDAIRTLTAEIFSDNGYRIFSANSGKQALELLAEESIDLMISDIIMPDLNGYQLAAKVQEQYPSVKIQLVSGYYEQPDVDLVDARLHKNIIEKPFEAEQLLGRVRDLLDNKQLRTSDQETVANEKIAPMQWADSLNVGQTEIDSDHKKLFALLNRCIAAANVDDTCDTVGRIINELIDYTKYHFQREEKFYKEHGYAQLHNHQLLHCQIIEELQQQKRKYEQGDLTVKSLVDFVSDWLINHILNTDSEAVAQCS